MTDPIHPDESCTTTHPAPSPPAAGCTGVEERGHHFSLTDAGTGPCGCASCAAPTDWRTRAEAAESELATLRRAYALSPEVRGP